MCSCTRQAMGTEVIGKHIVLVCTHCTIVINPNRSCNIRIKENGTYGAVVSGKLELDTTHYIVKQEYCARCDRPIENAVMIPGILVPD